MIHQRHDKDGDSGKQRRPRGQTVDAVDQVECVSDRQNPEKRQGKIDKPWQVTVSKQRREMKKTEAPSEKYQSCKGLNHYFLVRPESANVVPNTEEQD